MDTEILQIPRTQFSQILPDISHLEHESRRYLCLGLIVGIIIHATVGLLIPYNGNASVITERQLNSIPAEIIELPPRIQNPYGTWKRITAPRKYQRQSSEAPLVPGIDTGQPYLYELPQDRYNSGSNAHTVIEEQVTGTMDDSLFAYEYRFRGPQYDIPLSSPLFIDTGDYKSEIIFNPDNKRAIQGYVHFGIAWGNDLQPPDFIRQSVKHLAEALLTHTNIVATADRQIMLSTAKSKISIDVFHSLRSASERANYLADYASRGPKLNEYPFLFMATDGRLTLSEEEQDRLRNYLLGSGFLILDNGAAGYDDGSIDLDIRSRLIQILQPKDSPVTIWLTPLPTFDPLYHAFFDFPDGPPSSTVNPDASFMDTIYGIYTGGGFFGSLKLIGIYTPQGYSRSWHDRKNTEQLKMGVNMVVYALTRYKEALAADGKTSELISEQRILRK